MQTTLLREFAEFCANGLRTVGEDNIQTLKNVNFTVGDT
jgi:hypothetical protein